MMGYVSPSWEGAIGFFQKMGITGLIRFMNFMSWGILGYVFP